MTKYEDILERKKVYNQTSKHPCAICGEPCSSRSKVCKDCRKKDGKGMARVKKWRDDNKHPCRICGNPCDYRSVICVGCYRKHKNNGGISDKYCQSCGVVLAVQNKSGYCHKCYKGKVVYSWTGGKRRDRKGYIYIRFPEHHAAQKSGYVAEHIIIWEQSNGKPLLKGWVIHHLNGITNDNPSRQDSLQAGLLNPLS